MLGNLQQMHQTIQKTAEATDDLIGNKIADRITSTSTSPKKRKNYIQKQMKMKQKYQKKDIYLKKGNKLLMN